MKLQLTSLAAAVTFAMSAATFAAPQQPTTTIQASTNLTSVDWGVDNAGLDNTGGAINQDNNAWTSGPTPTFSSAQTALTGLNGNAPISSVTGNNNESESNQTGSNNAASIVQTNKQNESILDQTNPGTGPGSDADIQQYGQRNYSKVDQNLSRGGIVNIMQEGDFNDSRVDQYGGRDNKADVSQSGDRNNSVVLQGGMGGGADRNQAWVDQTGYRNDSYIGQTYGDDNYADVMQNGTNGESYIIQRGSDNIAFVNQTDGANDSYIMQDNYGNGGGSGRGHYADVLQGGGSNNVSTITQLGMTTTSAAGHAHVTQNGSGNEVSVLQY
ncbi:hypothetical protein [Vreelandella salicampi]|uniref:Curlin associated repeat-containing protein n=1 Tax=Vreelandella salicampi TaxID=1449798 RepID=A0A7Z0LNQ7_9GAMM|nr:hypothetical protein [Halomonas salicampi]NYS62311.1 hypothetical protein [Halomonas salicampi]